MMKGMETHEIQELLDLTGWSKRDLAKRLELNETTVYRWFMEDDRRPHGPAAVLMRHWLLQAREAAKSRPSLSLPDIGTFAKAVVA